MVKIDLKFNFSLEQSHRWADHVKAWTWMLTSGSYSKNSIKDVSFNRHRMLYDEHGKHLTPLMTALTYGLSMDQKMRIENDSIREAVKANYHSLDDLIEKDTDSIMEKFVDDANTLLLSIVEDKKLTKIINKISSGSIRDYGNLSFEKKEIEDLLTVEPNIDNIDSKIEGYIRSRLAQEYWTIKSAVTTYHLIVDDQCKERVSKSLYANADAIAWRITKKIDEIIQISGNKDRNFMSADHHLTDNKTIWKKFRFLQATAKTDKYFNNCPIAETYKVVDDILSQKYNGKLAGFYKGEMQFCEVCKQHGKKSLQLYLPSFFELISHEQIGEPISKGADYCAFRTDMGMELTNKVFQKPQNGKDRVKNAKKMIENPPVIDDKIE